MILVHQYEGPHVHSFDPNKWGGGGVVDVVVVEAAAKPITKRSIKIINLINCN